MKRSLSFPVLVALLVVLFAGVVPAAAQPDQDVEARVEKILSQMTLREKLEYIGGYNSFYIRPIKRLGLPAIKMSDGPVGLRQPEGATAFPAAILSTASWDRDLLYKIGRALGREARARGVHILLGPAVNIHRAPMCGRNFEYMGEDPFLAASLVVLYIRGVQDQGVAATVKHYVANNQEYDRHNVNSDMTERTLREIYLAAFRAAVRRAHVWAVMSAYNPVNGVHCSQNEFLLKHILKGEWGFPGVVMSDWGSTYDGIAAANAGLDLEMPSGKFMNPDTLLKAIQDGRVSVKTINDKVRRILRLIVSMGFLDRPQRDPSIPLNDPESRMVALQAAREGIVLLKNDGLLPLDPGKIHSIAVIGPNAHPAVTGGGGSSHVRPLHRVSVYEGIRRLVAGRAGVRLAKGIQYGPGEDTYRNSVFYRDTLGTPGLRAEYFSNRNLQGVPAVVRTDSLIDFVWHGPPAPGVGRINFSVRWTGFIRPSQTGLYTFFVVGDDGYRLFIGGQKQIDSWQDQPPTLRAASLRLKAGRWVPLRLEYYQHEGGARLQFGWRKAQPHLFESAVAAAESSDVAVVCVGFNPRLEGEGHDRPFALPEEQVKLIQSVAAANPNCVVVLNAGGNVDMLPWLGRVKALLHAWYPGQEGGTAVAEILFGKVNPSGKLPVTFEKRWEDNATYHSYYDADGDKHVFYREGVFLGYRHFDRENLEPLFPFGFGLSYTTYRYSKLEIEPQKVSPKDTVFVRFRVRNTGPAAGAEIAQLYVQDVISSVPRPVKELKGFARVRLSPGEERVVSIPLPVASLAFFDEASKRWKVEPGIFRVLVSASSRDIRLKGEFEVW